VIAANGEPHHPLNSTNTINEKLKIYRKFLNIPFQNMVAAARLLDALLAFTSVDSKRRPLISIPKPNTLYPSTTGSQTSIQESYTLRTIASMETSSQPQIPAPLSRDPSRSLTPLPLSASQEQQVRDIYYKKVRTICADEIRGMPMAISVVEKGLVDPPTFKTGSKNL
jgi:hypothetical protein